MTELCRIISWDFLNSVRWSIADNSTYFVRMNVNRSLIITDGSRIIRDLVMDDLIGNLEDV